MFKDNYNATLFYQIPQETTLKDECGFLEPEITYVEYLVRLSIEEHKLTNEEPNPGIDKNIILATGRLVNPRKWQSWMNQQRDVEIEFNNTTTTTYKGKAVIKPIVSSRLGLELWFGDYIQLEISVDI